MYRVADKLACLSSASPRKDRDILGVLLPRRGDIHNTSWPAHHLPLPLALSRRALVPELHASSAELQPLGQAMSGLGFWVPSRRDQAERMVVDILSSLFL